MTRFDAGRRLVGRRHSVILNYNTIADASVFVAFREGGFASQAMGIVGAWPWKRFGNAWKLTMLFMAAYAGLAQAEPDRSSELEAPPLPLTDCLNRKLAELRANRCKALWIECSKADLTQLVIEGGDDSVVLHPDPTVDRAWYWGVEIRHADRELPWVFLKGEIDGDEDAVSAHVVDVAAVGGAVREAEIEPSDAWPRDPRR